MEAEVESSWDRQRREERDALGAHQAVVCALSRAICEALGDGWGVEAEKIEKIGIGTLEITLGRGRDPRVDVQGYMPTGTYYGDYRNVRRNISVSASKSAAQIAKEIKSRLFPEYLPAYAKSIAEIAGQRAYDVRRAAKMERLRVLAGTKKSTYQHSSSGPDDKISMYSRDLRIEHYGDGSVKIEAEPVTEELAAKIIALFQAERPRRCEHGIANGCSYC